MQILTVRTDKPEAELGLYDSHTQLAYETWQAHRELAKTIHHKIVDLLKAQNKQLSDIQGVVCYQGPGSFTGLRIGLTVANTLAYGLRIPIVATQDSSWLKQGISRLQKGENDSQALPFYGADAHITQQKK
jgi:tRNA threonylcarbamoyladenosine biosynthesis protein TsaB